jgi:hypothetical protein
MAGSSFSRVVLGKLRETSLEPRPGWDLVSGMASDDHRLPGLGGARKCLRAFAGED